MQKPVQILIYIRKYQKNVSMVTDTKSNSCLLNIKAKYSLQEQSIYGCMMLDC